jgi:hypothetical protein
VLILSALETLLGPFDKFFGRPSKGCFCGAHLAVPFM